MNQKLAQTRLICMLFLSYGFRCPIWQKASFPHSSNSVIICKTVMRCSQWVTTNGRNWDIQCSFQTRWKETAQLMWKRRCLSSFSVCAPIKIYYAIPLCLKDTAAWLILCGGNVIGGHQLFYPPNDDLIAQDSPQRILFRKDGRWSPCDRSWRLLACKMVGAASL